MCADKFTASPVLRDGVDQRQPSFLYFGQRPQQRRLHVFRIGDRVLQLRNNYDLEVYNGDIGEVVAIDPIDRQDLLEREGVLSRSHALLDLLEKKVAPPR